MDRAKRIVTVLTVGAAGTVVRLVNWIFDPFIFLVIRLLADFIGGAWLIIKNDFILGLWLFFVGIMTLISAIKAKKQEDHG